MQVNDKPRTDHAWLKIEVNINKPEYKYREFIDRDYSKFSANEFIKLVEGRIEQRQELNIIVRVGEIC